MTEPRILVLIPARMAATRLPGKPLLDIAGLPMIVHVLRRAEAAGIGRVAVATDTPEIAAAVTAHGGEAVMTRADHPSGSDRIYEALCKLDPDGGAEIVVNLQGDLPTIPPTGYPRCAAACWMTQRSISRRWPRRSTPRKKNTQPERGEGRRLAVCPSAGCARCISPAPPRPTATARATITSAFTPIGATALERFVKLPPSPLEKREKLEQLRALEAGMRIDVAIVDTVPRGVDTPADLETARQMLAKA